MGAGMAYHSLGEHEEHCGGGLINIVLVNT